MKDITRKIAEVEWVDARSRHGWASDVSDTNGLVKSIGYVERHDRKEIVLVESYDFEPDASRQYGCSMAIPRVAVKKVRYLRGRKS